MAETIEDPSEIDAKAEEVNDDEAAKAARAEAAEEAYQKAQADKKAKADAGAVSAEAAYQLAVEAWFHEVGRKIGLAFPVYSDYEESE